MCYVKKAEQTARPKRNAVVRSNDSRMVDTEIGMCDLVDDLDEIGLAAAAMVGCGWFDFDLLGWGLGFGVWGER